MNEFAVAVAGIAGWVLITLYGMYLRSRRREMAHRERVAMIEKGIAPPPEADPAKFELLAGLDNGLSTVRHDIRAGRARRAGVVIMGVGMGVGWLLALTADNQVGLGVGGMIFILGLAFFLSASLDLDVSGTTRAKRRSDEPWSP
ncbi:MAG TPA: DUF6249 domain-containing protein [Vicinamibacterales bacterium]|jgi:hypothetical protein